MKQNKGISAGISRRSFLKGSAIGATATVASGLLGCSAGEQNAASTSTLEWSQEADIVILGFGYAAVGAAAAASEAGLSTLIVEKMDEANAGGSSCCNGGGVVPKTADSVKVGSYGRWSDAHCQDMAERAAAAAEWIEEVVPGITAMEMNGSTIRIHPGGGQEMYGALSELVISMEGVSVEYELEAKRLVVDPDTGEVIGVAAERGDSEILIKGKRAVVIATGGFASNKDMIHSFFFPCLEYASMCGPAITGDGIKLGCGIGAQFGNIANGIEYLGLALRKASEDVGHAVQLDADGVAGAIYVNASGKRFEDEMYSISHNKSTLPMLEFNGEKSDRSQGYLNMPTWAIWDSEMVASKPIGQQLKNGWANTHGFEWGTDNLAHVDDGYLIEADTLEELAAKMQSTNIWGEPVTVDAAGLQETVEAYNSYVEAGSDAEFGRDPESMTGKIVTPPFYAAELVPSIGYTVNGLVTDDAYRVLDWNGNPIGRLFAAGDIAQGAPMGVTGTIAAGRITGEQTAMLGEWDAAAE